MIFLSKKLVKFVKFVSMTSLSWVIALIFWGKFSDNASFIEVLIVGKVMHVRCQLKAVKYLFWIMIHWWWLYFNLQMIAILVNKYICCMLLNDIKAPFFRLCDFGNILANLCIVYDCVIINDITNQTQRSDNQLSTDICLGILYCHFHLAWYYSL